MENISFWWAVCWILSLPPLLYPKNLSGYVAVVEYETETRSAEYTVYTSKRALSSSVLFKQKINRYESRTGIKVQAILNEKLIRGVRHFLIRWKGYTEESDTWEPEHTLDCADLIKDYEKQQRKQAKKKRDKSKKSEDESATWDENEDFEVGRILDVYFHKDGKRDFLVSWKGYPPAQNSWEPEENMDCKDLINKFMLKVEAAKQFEGKETKLRTSRKPVERLEFSMHEHSRRLSKRYRGKERVHYFDAE